MSFRTFLRIGGLIPLVQATISLGGCAVGPDFETPAAPAVTGYTAGGLAATPAAGGQGGTAQRFVSGSDVPAVWWQVFRSRQIEAFVREAIDNHPDLAAAQAALRQAREVAAADTSALLPSSTGSASVTRNQVSPAQSGQTGPASLYTLYNTSVPVSFTPDIFGGKRRGIEADLANADYQRFQLEATYLTLTANVVTAAISDASYAAQIRVTQEQIDGQRQLVALLEQQFALGAVSNSDVLTQKAQLAQTVATLPPLQKSRAQNRNQLMAYLGRLPSQDKGEVVPLANLRLPRDLPVSVPSLLVRQRPDIRAAESQVHQASANVGVATANMLPNVTLSASGGSSALALSALYGPQTIAWSVAASITGPIFDAGSLFHTKESKVAALEQSSAQYRSTVITAFQNVADALRAIQSDAALLKAQVDAENTAAESLKMSQAQFKAGSTTFISVINAEQTLLTARINRVKAQASRYADTVALYQSLGGGWWNRVDETPAAEAKPAGIAAIFVPAGALPAPPPPPAN
ncbi:efflux transporter outer membrane subunit [Bradyrhizobium iriomotense]|uniref:efflux transporter outer membrane subunit n=1 Tax=Bradyrhizobium iriomotense TaxID=441950 RepID=UPI001B8A1474|nr:efflux transporter outer membrane subunit [Bradyrhizobium iriomotense]MBR0780129.1 efflux transporter outer membrane subunit [Bradyrhizobium iriomotense]